MGRSSGKWKRFEPVVVIAGYVAITAIAMGPVVADIGNSILGSVQPGDATAGGVWLGWQLLSVPPRFGHTAALNAPHGTGLITGVFVTTLAWLVPNWALSHLLGPIAGWNVTEAFGFTADAFSMYLLLRWLLGGAKFSRLLAFAGGILYAFSPFHVEEAYAHVGYLYSWIFPLILWSALSFLRDPTVRRGALFGAVTAVAAYFDGYYIVFGPITSGVVLLAGLVFIPEARRRVVKSPMPLGSIVGSALVVLLPLSLVYALTSAAISETFSPRTHLLTGLFQRARLWEYFVPWESSLIWGGLTKRWIAHQLHELPTEASLYLGTVVVVLAVGYLGWAAFQPKDDKTAGVTTRNLALTLVASIILLMICSFAYIGPIPSLPTILWKVEPLWRTFTRLDVAIDCLVVVAAVLALSRLAASRTAWLAAILAVLAVVDGTAILPWSSWSFAAHTPPAVRWLAHHQDKGIVADYPMLPSPLPEYQEVLTLQAIHRHPLLNGATQGTEDGQLARGLADITDPQTIPALRALGVRYILLDLRYYPRIMWLQFHLHGVTSLVAGGSDRVRLYKILPGPIATDALSVKSGVTLEKPFLPKVERWSHSRRVVLGLVPLNPRTRGMTVRFWARSYETTRKVTVYQGDNVKWRGTVSPGGREISFRTRTHHSILVLSAPGPQFVRGFHSKRALDLIGFDVTSSDR